MMPVVVVERAGKAIDEIWKYWAARASEGVADGQVSRIWGVIGSLGDRHLLGWVWDGQCQGLDWGCGWCRRESI
jgi:hypothetical protein